MHWTTPLWLVFALTHLGCGAKTGLGVSERSGSARSDGGAPYSAPAECAELRRGERPSVPAPQVDVLFVVDDSRSMAEEQATLAAAFPVMARGLITGDVDGDGELEHPPIPDLHFGVVTTDLGLLVADRRGEGYIPVACTEGTDSVVGGDGLLRSLEGCGAAGFHLDALEDTTESVVDSFGCVARVGIDGCWVEQPLEATLKALSPADGVTFAHGVGHGDGLNGGFLRPHSVLAIVILTDEDDRSLATGALFEAETEEESILGEDWLHPVERYVDGFSALRSEPDRLALAVIAGVPEDFLAEGPLAPEAVRALLTDERMQRVYDPDSDFDLRPSCETPGHGRAAPPRRILELAAALGDETVVHSICRPDYDHSLAHFAGRLGELVEHTWCVEASP